MTDLPEGTIPAQRRAAVAAVARGAVCGAELYPLCDRDAGWECIRAPHGRELNHRDLDGTEWPVGALEPLFLG